MRRRCQFRRGTVLLYFVLIVFALLGVGALVIDLGLARAAQLQMQAAADAAALEGLRWRDDPGAPKTGRDAAAALVEEAAPVAAPLLEFSGGLATGTSFRAAETLSIGARPIWVGDVEEDVEGLLAPNLLIQIRRTRESTPEGEVPVPYLFGRGSLLNPELKAQGITVRGTAIAVAMPVWAVGPAFVNQDDPQKTLPGHTPLAVAWDYWQNWEAGQAISTTVEASSGNIQDDKEVLVGRVIKLRKRGLQLGGSMEAVAASPEDLAALQATVQTDPDGRGFVYVPVFRQAGSTERLVGFGRVLVRFPEGEILQLTKQRGIVAPRNVSPGLVNNVLVEEDANYANDFATVLKLHREFAQQDSILTPVLAR